jgi:hypothetical protein
MPRAGPKKFLLLAFHAYETHTRLPFASIVIAALIEDSSFSQICCGLGFSWVPSFSHRKTPPIHYGAPAPADYSRSGRLTVRSFQHNDEGIEGRGS